MRPRWKDGPEFLFRFNGRHRAAWRRSRVSGSAVFQWIWLGQQGDFTQRFAVWLALHTDACKCILLLSSRWFALSTVAWLDGCICSKWLHHYALWMTTYCTYWKKCNDPNLWTFSFQFPGGSDNYLTISGSSHPFLSSSEVGLYIFSLHGNWILRRVSV